MNTSSDAAEQLVRISLNTVEVAAKITGSGAKNIAVMLYAIMKDQKQTKGKIRLNNMLKNGQPWLSIIRTSSGVISSRPAICQLVEYEPFLP